MPQPEAAAAPLGVPDGRSLARPLRARMRIPGRKWGAKSKRGARGLRAPLSPRHPKEGPSAADRTAQPGARGCPDAAGEILKAKRRRSPGRFAGPRPDGRSTPLARRCITERVHILASACINRMPRFRGPRRSACASRRLVPARARSRLKRSDRLLSWKLLSVQAIVDRVMRHIGECRGLTVNGGTAGRHQRESKGRPMSEDIIARPRGTGRQAGRVWHWATLTVDLGVGWARKAFKPLGSFSLGFHAPPMPCAAEGHACCRRVHPSRAGPASAESLQSISSPFRDEGGLNGVDLSETLQVLLSPCRGAARSSAQDPFADHALAGRHRGRVAKCRSGPQCGLIAFEAEDPPEFSGIYRDKWDMCPATHDLTHRADHGAAAPPTRQCHLWAGPIATPWLFEKAAIKSPGFGATG